VYRYSGSFRLVGCVVGGALAARATMSAPASRGSGGVASAAREEVEFLEWLEKQGQEVDEENSSGSTKTTSSRRLPRSGSETESSPPGSGGVGCGAGSGSGGGDEGGGAGGRGVVGGGGVGGRGEGGRGGGSRRGRGGVGRDNPSQVTGEARARAERRVAVFPLHYPTEDTTETAGGSGKGGSGGDDGGGGVGGVPSSPEERHFRRVAADLARRYLVNPLVEDEYVEKRGEMRARLGSGGVNERLLFHGTSFARSEGIRRDNFSLDKVGRVLTSFAFTPLLARNIAPLNFSSQAQLHNSHLAL